MKVDCLKLIFLFLWIMLLSSCTNGELKENLVYQNKYYSIELDYRTGSVVAITKGGENLLDTSIVNQPLFNLRFRNQAEEGKIVEYSALDAKKVVLSKKQNTIQIDFDNFDKGGVKARVTLDVSDSRPDIQWNISMENQTEYMLDHIDFPRLVVKNDLVATGGSGRVFWPAQEGCLVEDLTIRESSSWLKYRPIEYPQVGWGGVYPNSAQMQFMAYYNNKGGLYLASHDAKCNPKGLEFFRTEEGGIMLDLRLFVGGIGKGKYKLPYNVVTSVFDGNWYDAADIYRNWVQSSTMDLPPKIADNKNLPEWYFDSPVIVTYPIRGQRDMGDQTPNKLYPYTNALKYIDNFSKSFDSRIMALLMHWEGSAPWAPPYTWPPYGGEENYLKFVEALHAKNNLIGLYASGIGYTYRSNTDTTYNRIKEYEERNLSTIMKVAPDGKLATNGVCAGEHAQRIGWDMCPANQFVKDVVANEIEMIANSKTDYIQYFDQNLGGGPYHCYGTEHGHPYGPGLWMIEEMQKVLMASQAILKDTPNKVLIGCEATAAEPYMKYLLFNDARATINLFVGNPVPAYAYVYHEYVNNFMGNQYGVSGNIDMKECPYNLYQRLAYGFCAGDMLTVNIKDDGKMMWDWGGSWYVDPPNQKQTSILINNINNWRRKAGKNYLVYGRMQKPLPIKGDYDVPMIIKGSEKQIHYSSVFTSNWEYKDGSKAQFFVNYLPQKQVIQVDTKGISNVRLHSSSADKTGVSLVDNTIEIDPLNAVMISYR